MICALSPDHPESQPPAPARDAPEHTWQTEETNLGDRGFSEIRQRPLRLSVRSGICARAGSFARNNWRSRSGSRIEGSEAPERGRHVGFRWQLESTVRPIQRLVLQGTV